MITVPRAPPVAVSFARGNDRQRRQEEHMTIARVAEIASICRMRMRVSFVLGD